MIICVFYRKVFVTEQINESLLFLRFKDAFNKRLPWFWCINLQREVIHHRYIDKMFSFRDGISDSINVC
jgi:hypothetical protein